MVPDDVRAAVARILPDLVRLRHELHAHPETRFEERWTAARIMQFLDAAGVSYRHGYAKGTGIIVEVGRAAGKTVALRADLDALDVTEQTGLPYASTQPGRMHACGHDGHMACLCGAVRILAGRQDSLPGKVRFLFQPAEEIEAGARWMVNEGAVDGVDAVFGFHGWPALPLGTVAVKAGWFMASAGMFSIEVRGRGCHGASPASGVDPILVAAHIVTALQSIVAREVVPGQPAVVTVARITAGHAGNVIPDTATLTGTIRAFAPEVFAAVQASVKRLATATAEAFRATAEVRFAGEPYPALHNDARMVGIVTDVARAMLGEGGAVEPHEPIMVSEDFAYYAQRVPGAYFLLGLHPPGEPSPPALHSVHFDFNDAALPLGVAMLVGVALRFFEQVTD